MKLHKLENRKTGGYATFGSVWEQGEIPKAGFSLTNEKGEPVPVQSRVTAWWPDGSIKWAAHTADSSLLGEEAEILPLSDCLRGTGVLDRYRSAGIERPRSRSQCFGRACEMQG